MPQAEAPLKRAGSSALERSFLYQAVALATAGVLPNLFLNFHKRVSVYQPQVETWGWEFANSTL